MADVRTPEPIGDEDSRLLVAARRDPLAFGDLYSRNADRVVAYFYRRTLCAATSHELAAETFAKAYESIHRYTPTGGPGVAWIFGIAGNLHREWIRKAVVADTARRRLRIQTPVLVEEDLERIDRLVDLTDLRGALRDAVDDLSPALREAVVLRIALDLPYDEVADRLGCTIGAARVRVSRGLDRLLAQLGPA